MTYIITVNTSFLFVETTAAKRNYHKPTSKIKSNTQKKHLASLYFIFPHKTVHTNPKNMAMLKNKHIAFSLILVCLIIVSPMAKAQLGGLGGLGNLGGLGGLLNGLLGIINVNGVLRCSVNGSTSAPVFPNAGVQLQCGGNVVSMSTTNAAGIFSILVNPVQLLLNTLLSDCQLAVTTPLSTCNANLPSVGRLLSPLSFLGNTVSGLLSVANVVPVGFGLIN